MTLNDWPDCAIPYCRFKCCLSLQSDKCFEHTSGNRHVKHWKILARNVDNPNLTRAEVEEMFGEARGTPFESVTRARDDHR
jgi:hypothetical protein